MEHHIGRGKVIIYQPDDQSTQLEVRIEEETVWLSQKQMALIFNCSVDNVGLHLKNIYKEEELLESATSEDFSEVHQEGSRFVKRKVESTPKSQKPLNPLKGTFTSSLIFNEFPLLARICNALPIKTPHQLKTIRVN